MKDGVGECLLGDPEDCARGATGAPGAAEQTKPGSGVVPACRSKCSSETTLVEGYVHGDANILLGSLKRWLPMQPALANAGCQCSQH